MKHSFAICLVGLLACSGLVRANIPHHVKRALLEPDVHDKVEMYSEHHVDYSDAAAGRHVALHYQAQQHKHVTTWNLDDVSDLTAAFVEAGKDVELFL